VLTNIYQMTTLALATWVISTTITRARVFRPLRRLVKRHSDYLGEGISCQYCLSHWVGFILAAIYRPRFLNSGIYLVDIIVSAFVIIALNALIARTIGKTPPDGVLHPNEKAEREADSFRQEVMSVNQQRRQ